MGKMADAEIYDFLNKNECHLYRKKDKIIAWVAVDFSDLEEFQNIVGDYHFEDGGMEVSMMKGYISIELNGIIDIKNYKNCFDADEWRDCFSEDPTGEGKQ